MAVSLVEVSALRLPSMPGGIAHEAFKEDTGLLKQVCYGMSLEFKVMSSFLGLRKVI